VEDNIQTIVVVIVSVFLLFIFPVYMAYEKKDDISYALAMRYTEDLVDEVRDKGYITKNMYEDYRAKLKVTGNSYDIQLTHEYNRYDPVTNYYKLEGNKYVLVKTTSREASDEYRQSLLQEGMDAGAITDESSKEDISKYLKAAYEEDGIAKVEDTYQMSTEVYTTNHILSILNMERKLQLNPTSATVSCSDDAEAEDGCQYAYVMNVDDNFNVTIKNTNTTLATVIYNMVTANTLDENTRIYVNYGGTILSSKWYGSIDYRKMKHDSISLDKFTAAEIFLPERVYNAESQPVESAYKCNEYNECYDEAYVDEYAIEFDVKPNDVTVLKEKGNNNSVVQYTGYNFAVGTKTSQNEKNTLAASIGLNGISLITNISEKQTAVTTTSAILPTYTYYVTKYRTEQEEYVCKDEKTGENKICIRDKQVPYQEAQTGQRTFDNYSKIDLDYISKGRIKVTLTGKSGVGNATLYITLNDSNNLLKNLDLQIEEFTANNSYTKNIGTQAIRGTNVSVTVTLGSNSISISATKYVSNEMTILSYPMSIKDYITVRIEVKANENDKYVATLYIDGEKTEESIEMDAIPKVDWIGGTYIGNEARYFNGRIANAVMYYYAK